MTAAAATVAILRHRAVTAADVIALSLEVTGMTGRAVGRVLWPSPRNNRANGRPVALGTSRVTPVIAGIVAVRIVAEHRRRPGVGGMADVALFGGGQVYPRFGGRAASG